MKYGSVCSGIEAATVAWEPIGWRPAWFAEIEPFPCSVLAHRWPEVVNLGDMTTIAARIRAGEIAAPDILVGGTPCQAFSVAGARAGLSDPRGQLTLSYVDIANAIDAVRAVRGQPAAIIVWENVPGVFSSKDNAFGCFLGALAGESCELQPPGGKWKNAGCVYGPERSIAWRVLDAQYFGVAQRRRRVFVVASAREGFDPASGLFESGGVRRDSAPSREAGEGFAHDVALCLTSSGRGVGRVGDTRGQDPVVAVHGTQDPCVSKDVAFTLGRNSGQENAICGFASTGAGYWREGVGPLRGREQDSHENVAAFSCKDYGTDAGELSPTLRAMGHGASHANAGGQVAVCFPILEPGARTGKSTTDLRAGIGIGADADPMFTLQAGKQHGVAVAFAENSRAEVRLEGGDGQRTGALSAGGGKPGQGVPMVALSVALRGRDGGATAELGNEVQNCLRASSGGGDKPHVLTHMKVRRLTPIECERLQGFPDDYTLIPYRNKSASKCPDGPRYKAIGNSMAVPCMRWIGERINAVDRVLRELN